MPHKKLVSTEQSSVPEKLLFPRREGGREGGRGRGREKEREVSTGWMLCKIRVKMRWQELAMQGAPCSLNVSPEGGAQKTVNWDLVYDLTVLLL